MESLFIEYRCSCGQLFFKGFLFDSFIEIKCKRCKKLINPNSDEPTHEQERYLILYDHDGNIVDASPSCSAILGYERRELLKKKLHDICLFFKGKNYKEFFDKTMATKSDPSPIETFHKSRDGEIVHSRARVRFQIFKDRKYALVLHEVIKRDHIFA